MISDSTWMGSFRSSEYLTARSMSRVSSMRGAEKPGGDAMLSRFRSSLPPNSESRALFRVVVSLSEALPSSSMARFRSRSRVKYAIPPATSTRVTRTTTVRRKGLICISMRTEMERSRVFSSSRALARPQQLLQLVVAGGDSALHRGLEDAVAGFPRLVAPGQGHGGLAALLGEDQGREPLARVPGVVELLRVHQALVGDDLAVDAAHDHLGAVGVAPDEAVAAAHPEVDLADRQRPPAEHPQPALDQLRLRVRLEDEVAWSIEDARHHDLALAARRHLEVSSALHGRLSPISCCVHASSDPRAPRRAAGNCLPRSAGSSPATRWLPPMVWPSAGSASAGRRGPARPG